MMLATLSLIGAICVGGVLSGDKQEKTCIEHVNEMTRRRNTEPHRVRADFELPKCDTRGNYELKQCYGEWTGYGNCGCYKEVSGERIRRVIGVRPGTSEASQMTCQCAYDQVQTTVNLDCNRETGDYKPVRCVGSRCFCAERTGEPIYNYRSFNKGSSNCLCARSEHDYRKHGSIGRSWNCKTDGGYKPMQYHGSMVYCVNIYGHKIGRAYPIGSREAQNLHCASYSTYT